MIRKNSRKGIRVRKQIIFLLVFCIFGILLGIENQPELLNTSTNENLCYQLCCRTQDAQTLKECFQILSHEEKIKLFDEIPLECKEKFLYELSFLEYEKFLDDFSEHDWKRILKKIPSNYKNLWTKKIKKQRFILNKIRHGKLKI